MTYTQKTTGQFQYYSVKRIGIEKKTFQKPQVILCCEFKTHHQQPQMPDVLEVWQRRCQNLWKCFTLCFNHDVAVLTLDGFSMCFFQSFIF